MGEHSCGPVGKGTSLLKDEPFRVVSRQRLENSADYGTVRDCLRQRYTPAGSEIESGRGFRASNRGDARHFDHAPFCKTTPT